jgi:hypothetical protein
MRPSTAKTWILYVSLFLGCSLAWSQDLSLLPKYGSAPRTAQQQEADAAFIAQVDARYQGDRLRAARDIAERGWQALSQGNAAEAMRRFNQAWLLDQRSAHAIWGMAAVAGNSDQGLLASLSLFSEAEKLLPEDINLAVDYARAMGFAGAAVGSAPILAEADRRYAAIHQKAPGHTLNLQNWAIANYSRGDYRAAWEKIRLAEATPQKAQLDPAFIKALEAKMPRPIH